MKKENSKEAVCKSVFKDGGSVTSKARFTKKWIELVNRLLSR